MKKLKYLLLILFIDLISGCEKEDFDLSQISSCIMFISRRTENSEAWHLFLMNNSGTEQEKLTEIPVTCSRPVISNSGKTVLFVHYTEDHFYELYSIDIDGTYLTLIDRAKRYCGLPSWSIDDSKIIYSKSRNVSTDEKDLILMDFELKTKDTLTSTGDNCYACFTPDNKIIYCHSTQYFSSNIYKMNLDGSENQLLISEAWNPVISPNGEYIAYQSSIENGSSQIFVANINGANQKQLTSTYSSRIWPGWPPDGNYDPKWTPDSKKIVYVSGEDNDPEIYIMYSNGLFKTKLTYNENNDTDPVITADGQFILFSSNRNMEMNAEIFVMTINGHNQKALSNYEREDIYPVEVK